ncbi:membrane protein insertion efficiency factor YidD [bacterium]|nr:membrane protein insertion efficiency factor YidD [bacterium]
MIAISGNQTHSCRFHPTCSVYAKDCMKNTNFIFAVFLITWRLLRCNPLFPSTKYFDDAPQMRGSHR